MIGPGAVITDERGHSYRVVQELGEGGEGKAFDVSHVPTSARYVAKVMHPNMATKDTEERLRSLVALNLSTYSPAFAAPMAALVRTHGLGSIQPKAAGVSLEEAFAAPTWRLLDGLLIGASLARAVERLEEIGVAHGDLAASNVFVEREGDAYRATLIDFDNASVPGAPPSKLAGQTYYGAPELFAGTATTSPETDRFALAVLLHEILLLRHPFTTVSASMLDHDAYVAWLSGCYWIEDPIEGAAQAPTGAIPVTALSREIHQLFRRALQPDPPLRPRASEWAVVLEEAVSDFYECDCGGAFVNHALRHACPHCGMKAPALELVLPTKRVLLGQGWAAIGRDDLGGDLTVSREHALIRRRGFGAVVRCLSANGLAIDVGGVRRDLRRGEETSVAAGDNIILAPRIEVTLT